jgi:hypothetical protein
MNEVKICSKCLLPATLSGITFDDNGVCNHCRDYDRNFSEWNIIKDRKEKEMMQIFEKAKKLKRPYDCLVPLSGGKDSTYALYLATKVYKLRTLAVSLDNAYLSDLAKKNIAAALKSCSADHIMYTINKNNNEELFTVFVKQIGDLCNACMREINYAIELAQKSFHIPLIIKGSGRRVQYVSQIKETSTLNTASYFKGVIKGSPAENKFRHIARNRFRYEFQKIIGGICDILRIKRTHLMRFVPQHIGMYDYVYLPYPEIVDIIKREMNWDDGSGKVEHLDCELHNVPFYMNTLKIPNISKETFHLSGLIRQGIITREEALKRDAEARQKMSMPSELTTILQNNNITESEYVNYVKTSDMSRFEPRFQKFARKIYHKFRKY